MVQLVLLLVLIYNCCKNNEIKVLIKVITSGGITHLAGSENQKLVIKWSETASVEQQVAVALPHHHLG